MTGKPPEPTLKSPGLANAPDAGGAMGGTSGARLLAAVVAGAGGDCRAGLRAAGPWPAGLGADSPGGSRRLPRWRAGPGAWRRFRKRRGDALDRLDATMPGRPIAACAIPGASGQRPASLAVWQAHQDRMAARAARRNPWPARPAAFVARPAFAALCRADRPSWRCCSASFWQATSVAGLGPGAAGAMPGGPSWEAWAQPPAYTGKPTLYLNEITDADAGPAHRHPPADPSLRDPRVSFPSPRHHRPAAATSPGPARWPRGHRSLRRSEWHGRDLPT
jgi:hypothetical protein